MKKNTNRAIVIITLLLWSWLVPVIYNFISSLIN